jgi:hypothetical protein
LALLGRAGLASVRREQERAASLYRSAAEALDACDMLLHAAAARRALGSLLGGHSGQALVQSADAVMREQGVVKPERFVRVYAPVGVASGVSMSRPFVLQGSPAAHRR